VRGPAVLRCRVANSLARRSATPSNKAKPFPEAKADYAMDPLTAFLLGFGACLLIWLTAEVSWPRRRELEATPEEEFRLDPKNTPWRFWLFRTARFLFPSAIAFWIDMVRARRKRQASEKERDEDL
jgi:hypothetical protein